MEPTNIHYQVVNVQNLSDLRSRPGYEKENPLRKVPALKHEHGTLIESGAIAQFILSERGHGRLQPAKGSALWPRYLQWVWYGEATLTAPTGMQLTRFSRPTNLDALPCRDVKKASEDAV